MASGTLMKRIVLLVNSKHTFNMQCLANSPFDTPIYPIHLPRNVEYNEVFLFLCT